MCLLLAALLGQSAIAFAPPLSPKTRTLVAVSLGRVKTSTAFMKSASLDASHKATYSASQVAVVTHFCVERFQPKAVSSNTTAIIPDTDLQSSDSTA